jgi:DNA helicase-2/ATP-dependent DNA helicase PcrA
VLVRLTAQTPPVEQALIAAGIAYRIAGEEPFFRRREILDLLKYPELAGYDALLRTGNRLDGEQFGRFEACWRSLYNRPKRYLNRAFFQATLQAVREGAALSAALPHLGEQMALPERTTTRLNELAVLLRWLAEARSKLSAEALLRELEYHLEFCDFLVENSGFAETGAGYAANVTAFIDYARGKGSLAEFLAHLDELAAIHARQTEDDPQAVDIRTIHRAKGLEWPVVLVPNCNQGFLPFAGADDTEEERRLLYVAITRAKQELHLHTTNGADDQLSPFLIAARTDHVLTRVSTIEAMLERDPEEWCAADATGLANFPREFGQERFFEHWWPVAPVERKRAARRVLDLLQVVIERKGLERLGLTEADRAFWHRLAPGDPAEPAPPFADIDEVCPLPAPARPPRRTPAPAAGNPPYQIGERVIHQHFGEGVVVAVAAKRTKRKVEWYLTVEFGDGVPMKLVAGVAPLRKQ